VQRSEFEDWLQRDGNELRQGEIRPNEHRLAPVRDFDARHFILNGGLARVRGDGRRTFRPADVCNVPANTVHQEHAEAGGVRYFANRRMAAASEDSAKSS
jgi:hypothetical protein